MRGTTTRHSNKRTADLKKGAHPHGPETKQKKPEPLTCPSGKNSSPIILDKKARRQEDEQTNDCPSTNKQSSTPPPAQAAPKVASEGGDKNPLDPTCENMEPGSDALPVDEQPEITKFINNADRIIAELQSATTKQKRRDLIRQVYDGGYLSFSAINYVFDAAFENSEKIADANFNDFIADAGHHPADLAILLLSVSVMVTFAVFASKMLNNKKVQTAYKYIRDALSGIKNGRHAFVDTTFIINTLSHLSYHLCNPIGIALGAALAPALIAYRKLDARRNNMMDHNEKMGLSMQRQLDALKEFLTDESENFIHRQTTEEAAAAPKDNQHETTEIAAAAPKNGQHEIKLTGKDKNVDHVLKIIEDKNTTDLAMGTVQKRSEGVNAIMVGLSVFNGITDGPYMFGAAIKSIGGLFGWPGLAGVLTATAGKALLGAIAAYTVLSIVSSVYIEIERQKKLRQNVDETEIMQLDYFYKMSIALEKTYSALKSVMMDEMIEFISSRTDLTKPELQSMEPVDVENTYNRLNIISGAMNTSSDKIENLQSNLKLLKEHKHKISTKLSEQKIFIFKKFLQNKSNKSDSPTTTNLTLDSDPNDIYEAAKIEFRNKHGIEFGAMQSRAQLQIDMEKYERDIYQLADIENNNIDDTQKNFTAFLVSERAFKETYNVHGDLDYKELYSSTKNSFNELTEEIAETSKPLGNNCYEAHSSTPFGNAYFFTPHPKLRTKIEEKNQLKQKVIDLIQIRGYKEAAGIENNPIKEALLRYNTYCTEVIAGEKRLFRLYKLTSKDMYMRRNTLESQYNKILKIKSTPTPTPSSNANITSAQDACAHTNSTNNKAISVWNPYYRWKLNKIRQEVQEIDRLHITIKRKEHEEKRAKIYMKFKLISDVIDNIPLDSTALDSNSQAERDSKERVLSEIQTEFCQIKSAFNELHSKNSSDNLAAINGYDDILCALDQTIGKISSEKIAVDTEKTTRFDNVIKTFEAIHNRQLEHFEKFCPKEVPAKNIFIRIVRSIRGFITGEKNVIRDINCAITTPAMHSRPAVDGRHLTDGLVLLILGGAVEHASLENRYHTLRTKMPRFNPSVFVPQPDPDTGVSVSQRIDYK